VLLGYPGFEEGSGKLQLHVIFNLQFHRVECLQGKATVLVAYLATNGFPLDFHALTL